MELSVFQIAGLVFLFVMLALVIAGSIFCSMWDSREKGYREMLVLKDDRIVELQDSLREAMRYLDSSSGRGDLAGCTVEGIKYRKWLKHLEG